MTYDGVVLAGGAGRRLGGVNKPALDVGGRRLLDTAVNALIGAARTVVVGAQLPTSLAVTWTREQPPGGGPVAALAAALPLVESPMTVVLAADLPFVTARVIADLAARCESAAAVLAVDDDGRDQPLLACYDTARLTASLPPDPHGASMRSIVRALEGSGLVVRVAFGGPVTLDCDTEADLARAQGLA